MNRKQKIIVSITGIFIVLLALVGLTYGYFLTRIQGNTNTKSITVTTADLKLVYGDGDGDIVAENIIPGDNIDTKTFTVYNDGNATVSNYNVYLENVVNTFNLKSDIVYTLTCESDDNTNSPCTNQIEDETTFPSTNTVLLTNTIAEGDTHTYTLTIKYKETNEDQTEDMGKLLSAKINIYDANGLKDLNMSHYVLSNGALVPDELEEKIIAIPECAASMGEEWCINMGNTTTSYNVKTTKINTTVLTKNTFTGISNVMDSSDNGLFKAEDDYGTSYYYRGAVKNNYVNFAGFTWRIVRINGDSSVRLILHGTLDKVKREEMINVAGNKSIFDRRIENLPGGAPYDNAQIGYMYGFVGVDKDYVCVITTEGVKSIDTTIQEQESCTGEWVSGYNATHMNINDSTIKDNIDLFYETYIENQASNYHYGEYLADTLFCGDKTLASDTDLGYGTNSTYYAAKNRIKENNSNPTLMCAENELETYSRYTVESYKIENGVSTNGDLTYPIALLSVDEYVMAGAFLENKNMNYYIYDAFMDGLSYDDLWTMTPYSASGGVLRLYHFDDSNLIYDKFFSDSELGVSPVINIKSDVLVNGGNGTEEAPYTLRLAN